jgi:hypothetical protein
VLVAYRWDGPGVDDVGVEAIRYWGYILSSGNRVHRASMMFLVFSCSNRAINELSILCEG